MSRAASTLALPQDVATKYGLQNYGFHGSSHSYVSQKAATLLYGDTSDSRIITAHLGNGSSMSAIRGGRCIDTSMGFTPLTGLVMGTRPGDIDPAIVLYLIENTGMSPSQVADMLNKRSGLQALAGTSDFREVVSLSASGDENATLALEVWAWRIRHYIGAYAALLGGVDALVFTGGIGENSPVGRAMAVQGLEFLGLTLDRFANERASGEARIISPHGSASTVMVIPTNEELEIATKTHLLIGSAR
jgi:acetate kinase